MVKCRSQRKSFTWDKFVLFMKRYPLPKAKVYVNIFEVGAGINYYYANGGVGSRMP